MYVICEYFKFQSNHYAAESLALEWQLEERNQHKKKGEL